MKRGVRVIEFTKFVEGDTIYIQCYGHANSAPKGSDLVCAGVSAVLGGVALWIHNVNGEVHVVEPGMVDLSIPIKHEQVVELLVMQMEYIAEADKHKHINVNIDEGGDILWTTV